MSSNISSIKSKRINLSLKEVYKYIIAIPTYKRYNILNTHTLATLQRNRIDVEKIYIFVANTQEEKEYKKSLDVKYHNRIIIGKKGLKNQRNFISSYFPEMQCIVEMDDDLQEIYELDHPIKQDYAKWIDLDPNLFKDKEFRKKQLLIPIQNLNNFINESFKRCITQGIYLWGIYPTPNPYFMSFGSTNKLNFIVGPLFGFINRHNKELKLTVDEKENSERTLQYFSLDGAVLRHNNISIKTKYYNNPGGMQAEGKNRKDEAKKSVEKLHKKYPRLTKIYIRKSTGMPEIKLLSISDKK